MMACKRRRSGKATPDSFSFIAIPKKMMIFRLFMIYEICAQTEEVD